MRALFDVTSLTVVLCRDSVRSLLKSVKAAINSVVLSYLSARSFLRTSSFDSIRIILLAPMLYILEFVQRDKIYI